MNGHAFRESQLATLKVNLPTAGLQVGDVGTIVFVYGDGEAYDVEFVDADGQTIALENLRTDQIEPFAGRQVLHARKIAPA